MANNKVLAIIMLTKRDNTKFLAKNCIQTKITKNVAIDKNKVSTIFINLNFDMTILLTLFNMLNLLDNLN